MAKNDSEEISVIGKFYYDFPLTKLKLKPGSKVINGHRVSGYSLFTDTEDNLALALHHNEILKKIEDLQDEANDILKKMEKYNP